MTTTWINETHELFSELEDQLEAELRAMGIMPSRYLNFVTAARDRFDAMAAEATWNRHRRTTQTMPEGINVASFDDGGGNVVKVIRKPDQTCTLWIEKPGMPPSGFYYERERYAMPRWRNEVARLAAKPLIA